MRNLFPDDVAAIRSFSIDEFMGDEFVENYWIRFGLAEAFLSNPSFDTPEPSKTDQVSGRGKKWASVDPKNNSPLPPQKMDLAVFHFLVVSREVASAVEFGAGYSTGVLGLALEDVRALSAEWVEENRRVEEPFTLTSVDESQKWLSLALSRLVDGLRERIKPVLSPVETFLHQGRWATRYSGISDPVADFVLIDGPSQYPQKVGSDLFTIGKQHLKPMAADVLLVEHFYDPGTIIFVDGRTANARFLKANFQRDWVHKHFVSGDFHLFELQEEPLGPLNQKRLNRLPGWVLN